MSAIRYGLDHAAARVAVVTMADGSDDAAYDMVAPRLAERTGRLLNDKAPTGVAVDGDAVERGAHRRDERLAQQLALLVGGEQGPTHAASSRRGIACAHSSAYRRRSASSRA